MNNLKYIFTYDDVYSKAEDYFFQISKLKKNKEEDLNLINYSNNVLEKYFKDVEITLKISVYDKDIFYDDKIVVNGSEISCERFKTLEKNNIENVYFYVLTLGDLALNEIEGTLDQYYYHVWGTSFIEAGREMLESKLMENLGTEFFLTKPFDPGFDGMDIYKTKNILKATEAETIGVSANENGLMMPLKTVAGIYLAVTTINVAHMANEKFFENCTVNSIGCDFCKRKQNCPFKNISHEVTDEDNSELKNMEMRVLNKLQNDFDSSYKGKENYGIAFDIGTTTVVGLLWDIKNFKLLNVASKSNMQSKYGGDIISRLAFAVEKNENIQILQREVMKTINEIIEDLCEKSNIVPGHVTKVVLAGNTAISHFVMGVNPKRLSIAPFIPEFVESQVGDCNDLGIRLGRNSEFYLIPNLACHVGSDISAGLVAEFMGKSEKSLLIDIGTNGEMAISKGENIVVTSAAAGPAFEGASVHMGMRAQAGAIEAVSINEDKVDILVKGNCKPKGICGSGIIDCISTFLNNGIIDETGRMFSGNELKERGYAFDIFSRIREGELGREFILSHEESGNVVILQKDIREVQMAKAAFVVAIKFLMEEVEIKAEDLDKIYVAGAFGNNIKIESAIKINILPHVKKEKIECVGNAAGIGVSMVLLCQEVKIKCEEMARTVRHLEVTNKNNFQEEFLKSLNF